MQVGIDRGDPCHEHYDVDDYRDVDPRLGTLADFDEMTARLHARKIKVIVDIVPNHTSDRHAWFREAVSAPAGSPARDRYIFRDGLGPDGDRPPSDWASVFGGPAWTRVPDGQWYLHLIAPQQPDLNWANREVRDDFLTTLRFWSDRGVDGFRVDVAHGLAKNLTEPLESLPVQGDITDGSLPPGSHPLWDRDEVHDIYAEWRRVFNEYDPPRSAVAEAWVPPEDRRGHANARTWLLTGGASPRLDRGLGLRRARAAILLVLALPGSAYLYQGEELGLHEVPGIPPDLLQDPVFSRSHGAEKGRDGCRVARPGGWRCVTNFGPEPVPLPGGAVILTSVLVTGPQLPADTTAWLISG